MGFADASSFAPASRIDCPSDHAHQMSVRAWRELPSQVAPARTGTGDELWTRVRAVIQLHLTERQRQVLELYYLRGLDQAAVATLLGISQQSVSEHLFGKQRNHRQVGGLVRKLRKLCQRNGIAPGFRLEAHDDEVA